MCLENQSLEKQLHFPDIKSVYDIPPTSCNNSVHFYVKKCMHACYIINVLSTRALFYKEQHVSVINSQVTTLYISFMYSFYKTVITNTFTFKRVLSGCTSLLLFVKVLSQEHHQQPLKSHSKYFEMHVNFSVKFYCCNLCDIINAIHLSDGHRLL